MPMFIRAVNGTYYGLGHVKAIYVDNNGPTDWYVSVIMTDATSFNIAEGLASSDAANDAATRAVTAAGVANPA